MAAYYFDSSAIAKRYVAEVGTAWVLALTDPTAGNDIFIVRITAVEVVSALVRHLHPIPAPLLTTTLADFKSDFQQQYQIVEVTEPLIHRAMALAERHHLRGHDTVQLAAALELHAIRTAMGLSPLIFVSADTNLNAVAALEGLTVENPNLHP